MLEAKPQNKPDRDRRNTQKAVTPQAAQYI